MHCEFHIHERSWLARTTDSNINALALLKEDIIGRRTCFLLTPPLMVLEIWSIWVILCSVLELKRTKLWRKNCATQTKKKKRYTTRQDFVQHYSSLGRFLWSFIFVLALKKENYRIEVEPDSRIIWGKGIKLKYRKATQRCVVIINNNASNI